MHLTHAANTLGAEVNLAADASSVWASDKMPPPADPQAPTPEIRRVACGGYGGINRSSDPLIGMGVGDAVGSGARVTLTDPIGLYVANADLASLAGPAGQSIPDALTIVRGNDDPFDPRILRFEVSLKAGTPFGLEECKLDGRPLRSGGQIARKTTMHLYANAYPGNHDDTALGCGGRPCRNPQRTEIFSIGPRDAVEPCPEPADTIWLMATPFEGGGPPAMVAEATHAAAPQVVVPSATVPASLSKSRNPVKA
jgi:hypothetical protein